MKFMEVELKYRADEISLPAFKAFCVDRGPKEVILASGYDHFYSNTKDPDAFCRHRTGTDFNQLTFKRKTVDNNNYVRTEHNLDLAPKVSEEQVKALCSEFGYQYNTSIFKTCYVYIFDWYVMAYYVCYDSGMKEVGRFVEIEAKESADWRNQEHAWSELLIIERTAKQIGLSAQGRLKRSLYEMFRAEASE